MNGSVGVYNSGHCNLFLSFSSSMVSCLELGAGGGMFYFLFGPSDCLHSRSYQCCLYMVLVMFGGKNVGGKPYILHFKIFIFCISCLSFWGMCVYMLSLYETVYNSTSYNHYLMLRNRSFNCHGNSHLCFWEVVLVRFH